jgi:hypothetical protein
VELVAFRQREDFVLNHQRGAVWPVEYQIHIPPLSLDEATRVGTRRGQRTERSIGGFREQVEVPADEVGVEELALSVHQSPARIRFDASSGITEIASHARPQIFATAIRRSCCNIFGQPNESGIFLSSFSISCL